MWVGDGKKAKKPPGEEPLLIRKRVMDFVAFGVGPRTLMVSTGCTEDVSQMYLQGKRGRGRRGSLQERPNIWACGGGGERPGVRRAVPYIHWGESSQ